MRKPQSSLKKLKTNSRSRRRKLLKKMNLTPPRKFSGWVQVPIPFLVQRGCFAPFAWTFPGLDFGSLTVEHSGRHDSHPKYGICLFWRVDRKKVRRFLCRISVSGEMGVRFPLKVFVTSSGLQHLSKVHLSICQVVIQYKHREGIRLCTVVLKTEAKRVRIPPRCLNFVQ